MSNKLLIILSPPRSFSSVVSTMIGQHPEIYCFPELHLFSDDSVGEILEREQKRARNYAGPPGVLRALAQLHDGIQTTETVLKAGVWLNDHQHWTTKQLIDYMLARIAPLPIGVEKSPVTCMRPSWLRRAYAFYPDACYLHLTRHPIGTRNSMEEFFEKHKQMQSRKGRAIANEVDHLLIWYRLHLNIVAFTKQLPTGQLMRLKGEDLLSDPDLYLPQIAEWLGVRTDLEAIEEMKHPENSPYACVGPAPTRGGNDSKFMRSPALRGGAIHEPSLKALLMDNKIEWMSDSGARQLEAMGATLPPYKEIVDEVRGMAQCLGYQ